MAEDLDLVPRLVERIQAGVESEDSFREIFRIYHSRVEAFFLRKYFLPDESRDLAQETFLQVFKALPSFRQDSSFLVWLFGIMRHVYLNEIRRRRSEKRVGLEVSLDSDWDKEGSMEPVSMEPVDSLSSLISRERANLLFEALKDLPNQMRLCCTLRYEQGLKYQEIATLMNISIETVKAHLHQARKRLTEKLGKVELS